MTRPLVVLLLGIVTMPAVPIRAADWPPVAELPERSELPDPLTTFAGGKIDTPEAWWKVRRPELISLFEHYMYGSAPAAPSNTSFKVERTDEQAFGGKATLREVTVKFGPELCPPIRLLVVVPNKRAKPAPVFVGLNFHGNHTLVDDPEVALAVGWLRAGSPGGEGNRATDAGRGTRKEAWSLEQTIDAGFAAVTFFSGDVDPDRPDFTDGVHPHFFAEGQTSLGPHEWGTIRAWAWGISRAVDYIATDDAFDQKRIICFGHSRNGKTALLATALDERIALAIPHQAGCGGTAPSRGTVGESVKQINDRFPHWFNDTFPQFNEQVDRLPFDQHCLVAIVAPRPVLFSNATEDQWANPNGQFEMLRAATPVYKLLGVDGLQAESPPAERGLINSRLGYFLRPGKHSTTAEDWRAFYAFAKKQLEIVD